MSKKRKSWMIKMIFKCFFIMTVLVSVPALGEDITLVYNVTDTGYPPFMIHPDSPEDNPRGIMYDILESAGKNLGFKVKVVTIPKKREIYFFNSNLLDVHATAREWVSNPSRFVFSEPVIKVKNVLFSLKANPFSYKSIDDLNGKTAVAHIGFVYPPLTAKFESGTITRVDAGSEVAMLRMIQLGRGDFAIINNLVGAWHIKERGLEDQFHATEKAVTDYEYRFMFSKKWAKLVPKFNQELKKMKTDGRLSKIIKKYGYTANDLF
jgi:polar amino acid transport system substrate-binding protein